MAWQVPKIDWKAGDSPSSSDFNRIEGNIAELDKPLYGETAGNANNYYVNIDGVRGCEEGLKITVKINVASTSISYINVNSSGFKAIKKPNGKYATNLKTGGVYTLVYDGVNFILQGEGGEGTAQINDVMKGKTFTNDDDTYVGVLELTGDALVEDVLSGKTFYNSNPKIKSAGTLELTGNARASKVPKGNTFYTTDPKNKLEGYAEEFNDYVINPKIAKTVSIPRGYFCYGNKIESIRNLATLKEGTYSVSISSNRDFNISSVLGFSEIIGYACQVTFDLNGWETTVSLSGGRDIAPGNSASFNINNRESYPYVEVLHLSLTYDDDTDRLCLNVSRQGSPPASGTAEVKWRARGIL